MAEGDTWERKENLKNAKELIEEFEREEVVVRRQVEDTEEWSYQGNIQRSCCMGGMIKGSRKNI